MQHFESESERINSSTLKSMESSRWLLLHENVILKNIVFSSSSYTHLLCGGPITSHLIQGFWLLADFFKVPTLAMLSAEKEWGCICCFFFVWIFLKLVFQFLLVSVIPCLFHDVFFFSLLCFLSPLSDISQPSFKVIDLENKTKQNKKKSNSQAKCKYLDRCSI